MPQVSDLNRSRTALEQGSTLIAVIEMSLNSWVIAAIVPGIERHPLKKLAVNEDALLRLLRHWQAEAVKAGQTSNGWQLPSRLGATAFGWRGGFGRARSKRM